MNVIKEFSGDHFFLSNFSESLITWTPPGLSGQGLMFASGEHAFQATKYKAMTTENPAEQTAYINDIINAKTPRKAKELGGSVEIDVDKWNAMRVQCMRMVVFEKFRQRPNLRKALLNTGHALLVEGNTWNDTFWGRCNGKGSNILGSILMEIRGYWLWQENTVDITTPVVCTSPCVCTG